ncbi:hypothetical protein VP1G_04135 [Cytospora mali]|uniref:Uncharacterized protein n=1 Tax=Cytospora mali TaxID=578113 RepID=A0A194UYI7_CYTMA|nr:hypothetical protein VP1G_04135 [Valsa mali var. pyri (nom. inval.)]
MADVYGGILDSSSDLGRDGGPTTYHLATTSSNATTEATRAMTNALTFATSKSIRTSTIILASFNALAALATALGIIHGCYTYSKRAKRSSSNPSVMEYETKRFSIPNPDRPSGLFFIHTVEVFPLVLSSGIAIQSIVFAAAQSIGLQALLGRGCATAAIFTLPALFIAPYIQVVFGVETAVRGLRSQFSARRKWTVAICLGIVATFLLVSLFVAIADRAPDFCFVSLFWIIAHYAEGCFVLLFIILIVLISAIGTIFVRLIRGRMVEPAERVAASRMIYYLALGFISNAFIIPYFFSLTFLDQKKYIFETLNLSMMASVVSNVNGLMVAGLHLFLRSQNNTAIGHNYGDHKRHKFKHDPQDSIDGYHGSTQELRPVTGPNNESRAASVDAEEGHMGGSPTHPNLPGLDTHPMTTAPQTPTFPEPTQTPAITSPSELRKQAYSLFPNNLSAADTTLPAATYSSMAAKPATDSMRPPPVVKPWLGRGHRRDSSTESSAILRIGIRFSNVNDFQPYKTSMDTVRPEAAVNPSPLAQVENRPASENVAPETTLDAPPEGTPVRDARMKTLPPVPKPSEEYDEDRARAAGATSGNDGNDANEPLNHDEGDRNQPITLGPSVYTPEDSIFGMTAPNRGLNRSARIPNLAGPRFNTMASRDNSDRGSVRVPPPRPNGSAVPMQVPPTGPDWI